jgi:cell division septum initiation protein DivIVA
MSNPGPLPEASAPAAGQHAGADTEALLRRVMDLVQNAKAMPLSASVLIAKDEFVDLLEAALERLPEELRQARWMLKERDDYLARARREGDQIIEAARARAESMVQRTDIVREAKFTAQRTVDEAEAESRKLRMEADDYVDRRLAKLEIELERITKQVHAGRQRLQVAPSQAAEAEPETAASASFFDQDRE